MAQGPGSQQAGLQLAASQLQLSAAQMGRGARSAEPLLVAAQQQGRGVGDGFGDEVALRSSLEESNGIILSPWNRQPWNSRRKGERYR